MKVITIDFCDFWPGFDKNDNFIINLLRKHYEVLLSPHPDFVFFSTSGNEYKNYNCIRIYYSGESFPPDYLQCDYSISFELDENVRNLRYPLYLLYGKTTDLLSPKKPYAEIRKQHTRFCNMVVSNARATKRIDFFHKLSKYKPVDSGGKYLNNVGGPVANKRAFISSYKFSIAFENKAQPGYTTEKLVEPMYCGSMPIYWGNPEVGLDFNPASFINWNDYGSDEAVIDRIIELDQNEDLYEAVYNQPFFVGNTFNSYCGEERLLHFLQNIIHHPLRNRRFYYGRKLTIGYYQSRVFLGALRQKLLGKQTGTTWPER